MSDLTLYTNQNSRGAIAQWMLNEIGVEYDRKEVAYGDEMHGAAFMKINPMGKVPALMHGKHIVTEAAAICAYLADVFADKGLGPNPEEKASYYRWLFFAAGPLESAISTNMLGANVEEEKRPVVGFRPVAETTEVLAGWLSKNDYVTGSRFTAADVYVGSHIAWGTHFGSIPALEAFKPYLGRITERKAYKDSMPDV